MAKKAKKNGNGACAYARYVLMKAGFAVHRMKCSSKRVKIIKSRFAEVDLDGLFHLALRKKS